MANDIIGEEWRPVKSYPGFEASSLGRVRNRFGRVVGSRNHRGYVTIHVRGNDAQKWPMAHRLVAEAFHGPRPDGMEVNHKNGVRDDNRPDNLEYLSPRDNTQHAILVLGVFQIPTPDNSKVTPEQVAEIRRSARTVTELAKIYNVSRRHIGRILKREARTDVP